MQNRTKTGKQKVLEGEGAAAERTRSPSGAFDLLDITAVGGAQSSETKSAAAVASPSVGEAKPAAEAPVRKTYPTPGGGLPGLLARTQLGLGDSLRSVLEAGARAENPVSLKPLRPTPTGAGGFDSVDTTATGSAPEEIRTAQAVAVVSDENPVTGVTAVDALPADTASSTVDGSVPSAEVPADGGDVVAAVLPTETPVSGPAARVAEFMTANVESVPVAESAPIAAADVAAVAAVAAAAAATAAAASEPVAASAGQVTDAAVGPVADTGATVAASGPVFDLATGPVASGSGPVSGPVFDLISGPITNTTVSAPPAAVVAAQQAAPRRSHPTPASGRLAALLAESRKRTGRHETLEKAGPAAEKAASVASGAGTPSPVAASPSAPIGFSPVGAEEAGSAANKTADAQLQSPDVATVRVPGAAVAQKKGPGFAATLLGLPAPDMVAQAAAAVAQARKSLGGSKPSTMLGRERHLRDSSLEAGADQNTPLPVEGEATERSPLSTADVASDSKGWRRNSRSSGNSEEQKRLTQIIDIVRPNRSGARTAAFILGGTAVVVIALVSAVRIRQARHRDRDSRAAVTAPVAPTAPIAAPAEPPSELVPPAPAVGALKQEPPVDEPAPPPPAAEARTAEEKPSARAEKPITIRDEEPKAPADSSPPLPAHAQDDSSSKPARGSDGESKRKVARSESHRSDTPRAEPKVRRRGSEGRASRSEGSATAAAYQAPPEAPAPRPRVAQPVKPLEADPDATMPLSTR